MQGSQQPLSAIPKHLLPVTASGRKSTPHIQSPAWQTDVDVDARLDNAEARLATVERGLQELKEEVSALVTVVRGLEELMRNLETGFLSSPLAAV